MDHQIRAGEFRPILSMYPFRPETLGYIFHDSTSSFTVTFYVIECGLLINSEIML